MNTYVYMCMCVCVCVCIIYLNFVSININNCVSYFIEDMKILIMRPDNLI